MLLLNRSVKLRLGASLGLCIAMVIVIGLFALWGLSTGNQKMRGTYDRNVVTMEDLGRVSNLLLRNRVLTLQAQRDKNVETFGQLHQVLAENDAEADEAWADYYPERVDSDAEKQLATQFQTALSSLRADLDEQYEAMMRGDFQRAQEISSARLNSGYTRVLDTINQVVELNRQQAGTAYVSSTADYERARALTLGAIALAIVIGVGLSIWLTRGIMTPLGKARALADALAEGKLGNDINITCKDEFGDMLRSLQTMEERFSNVVLTVRKNAESVDLAANEIAQGTDDLSRRTQEQAASLEQTAASMDEITSTVRQNAENALAADRLVNDLSQQASSGGEVAQKAVEAMSGINASSREIAGIVGLIDEIAFQTNLLALNASVEAARAGEQGRGFAVVASEVRNLASRSAEAAKDIKRLVEESIVQVNAGSALVDQAGNALAEIVEGIHRVTTLAGEIAVASREQSQGIDQVNTAVSQMDGVTQQNASLVEESSAASRSLQKQAAELLREVSFFKGAEDTDGSPSRATSNHANANPPRGRQLASRQLKPRALEPARESADWEAF
ncbi:methyl-accepting chemotaxis protein [Salinicola sp. CR57]|uniref:methyl-accepting chemotaxis protein n=1 Tax=Salinicola sp. CR57 TaxID=1949086 RepID=UPI000DA16705|nr:methyl-accepting chemotaxis protein [Salinicola sp. CR57]